MTRSPPAVLDGKHKPMRMIVHQNTAEIDWVCQKIWRVYLLHIYFTILTMHDYGYRSCSKYNEVKSTHTQCMMTMLYFATGKYDFTKTGFPMARNYYSFHMTWQREVSGQNIQTKSSAQRLFRNKKKNCLTASFCIINFCLCFFSYWLSLTLVTKWICNKLWGWVSLNTELYHNETWPCF